MATRKKTTTKARKGSTTTKAKAKAKSKRAGIKLVATDAKEPTSKMRIYTIYKGRKSVEPSQAEELIGKAKGVKVKVSTVKSWISSWNRGLHFPTR